MTRNITRFAAVLSLTVVLGATPAMAGRPSRDSGGAPERPSIVRIVQNLMQRLLRLLPTEGITVPIPSPSSTNTNTNP